MTKVDYMKAQYEQLGNTKMVEILENCPIRESDEIYAKYFSSSLQIPIYFLQENTIIHAVLICKMSIMNKLMHQ